MPLEWPSARTRWAEVHAGWLASAVVLMGACAPGPPSVSARGPDAARAVAATATARRAPTESTAPCASAGEQLRVTRFGDALRLEACGEGACPWGWARVRALGTAADGAAATSILVAGERRAEGFQADCGNWGECMTAVAVACAGDRVALVLPFDYRWTLEPDGVEDGHFRFVESVRPGAAPEESGSPIGVGRVVWRWQGSAYQASP